MFLYLCVCCCVGGLLEILTAKVCDEVIKVVNVDNDECSVFGYFGICVFVYLCVCCCVGGLLEILSAKVCDEVIKIVNVVNVECSVFGYLGICVLVYLLFVLVVFLRS